MVRDVTGGVARDFQHLEHQAQGFDPIMRGHAPQRFGHGFAGRADHPSGGGLPQLGHATGVVRVVVGDGGGVEFQPLVFQPLEHLAGLSGVDHERAALVVQNPDVVVGEDRDGV